MNRRAIYIGIAIGAVLAMIVWQVGFRALARERAKENADSAAAVTAAIALCEAKLDRCGEALDTETKRCLKAVATQAPLAYAAPSASAAPATSSAPSSEWRTVDDLAWLAGTWVSEASPEVSKNAQLVDGALRVTFKKGGTPTVEGGKRKSRTPWSFEFIAPNPGHHDGATAGGGCGFYEKQHQKNDGEVPWRQAYCSGYGKGDSLKAELRVETDGRRVRGVEHPVRIRVEVDGWIAQTVMVRR